MKACVVITSNNEESYQSVATQKDCGQCDVVINRKNDGLDTFLPKIFTLSHSKLEPTDVIILLHNQDRLAGPHAVAKILDTLDKNPHVSGLYTDTQEMVDGFLTDRYMPAYSKGITDLIVINTPIAFRAGIVDSLPHKYDNVYHDFFKAATNKAMGHHIAEPLFICQI